MKHQLVLPIAIIACLLLAGVAPAQTLRSAYEAGKVEWVADSVFGSQDDEDDAVLYGPVDVAVDNGGNVYVLDHKMFCVKKYDPDGEMILEFSRQGEGPGELARASKLVLTPEGNVLVFDSGNHRFTLFDREGEYLESQGYQGWVFGMDPSPDGSLVLLVSIFNENWMEFGSLYKLVRLSPDLKTETPIDSAYIKTSQVIQATDNSMTSVGKPFVGQFVFAVSPTGELVYGIGDKYELDVLSADLEKVRKIKRDVQRPNVTDADKEEYFDNFEDSDENLRILVREEVSFPRQKPHISNVFIDREGNILVQTYAGAQSEDNSVYDVFAPDGHFLSRVEMLDLRGSALFVDDFLFMTKYSDDELPVVVRYRLKSAGGETRP